MFPFCEPTFHPRYNLKQSVIAIFVETHELFQTEHRALIYVCRGQLVLMPSCIKECRGSCGSLMSDSKSFRYFVDVDTLVHFNRAVHLPKFATVVAARIHPVLGMSCTCWRTSLNLRHHCWTLHLNKGVKTFCSWYATCPFIVDNNSCSHLWPQLQNAPALYSFEKVREAGLHLAQRHLLYRGRLLPTGDQLSCMCVFTCCVIFHPKPFNAWSVCNALIFFVDSFLKLIKQFDKCLNMLWNYVEK